jgi:hypothetical protein
LAGVITVFIPPAIHPAPFLGDGIGLSILPLLIHKSFPKLLDPAGGFPVNRFLDASKEFMDWCSKD